MELNETVLNSIDRYFNHLASFGQSNIKKQHDILKLILIKYIIYGPMSIYVTEEDYKVLDIALQSIYGSSCLINYPNLKLDHSIFEDLFTSSYAKLLEDSVSLKTTEGDNIRFQLL